MTATRTLALVTLAALVVACSGCIWRIGPGAAARTLVYTDTTYPNITEDDPRRTVAYDPEIIEIIGWVETGRASADISGRIPGLFGSNLAGFRDSDYASSLDELKRRHNIDGLLNTIVDTDRKAVNLILIRASSWQTVVGGVGYRFRDRTQWPAVQGTDTPTP